MRILRSVALVLVIAASTLVAPSPASADATLGSITGTVSGGGGAGPLVGVKVSANPVIGYAGGTATTDANGRYTIVDVAPGEYDVNAFSPDYPSTGNTFDANHVHRASVTAHATTTVDFLLTHGATLSGRVVDTAGNAVAGALLFVVYDHIAGIGSNHSDDNGYFAIGLGGPQWIQEAEVGIYASKDGFISVGTVDVTLHENQHENVTVTVAPIVAFTSAPAPKITGTLRVGKTLRAHPGAWKPSPGRFDYQWYRSGTRISGATRVIYKLSAKDLGKKMTVTITGWVPSRLSTVKTSASTKKVAKRK